MKILLTIATISSLFAEKLVNIETGSTVVEFLNGNIQFHDLFLALEMKETGIYIPSSMGKEFDERQVVYLGDPLFEKAFIDVYYPLCISNAIYQWQE